MGAIRHQRYSHRAQVRSYNINRVRTSRMIGPT